MSQLSHIQNTRSIFKGFIDEKTKKLFMLNLNNNQIRLMSPKKIGTKKDYYYSHNEVNLNRFIEDKFGKVLSRIREFIRNQDENIILTNEEVKSIVEFALFLVFRSNRSLIEGRNNLLTKDLYDEQTTHNHFIEVLLLHKENNDLPQELNKMTVNLLFNKTKYDFITSRNGFCEVKSSKVNVTVIPIDPKTSFLIYEKNQGIDNNKPFFIDNDDTVNKINLKMLECEKIYNNDFIASKNKETLQNMNNLTVLANKKESRL